MFYPLDLQIMYSDFYFRFEADARHAVQVASRHGLSVDGIFKMAALGGWWVCRVCSFSAVGFRRSCLGLYDYEIKSDYR